VASARNDWVRVAIIWSAAGHLFALGLMARLAPRVPPDAAERSTLAWFEVSRPPGTVAPRGAMLEINPPLPGHRPQPVRGPADAYHAEEASPWPRADVDAPDPRAAGRGGQESGGPPTYTGRNDGHDELHALPWNDPRSYRLPRTDDARRPSSPEQAISDPDPGLDTANRRAERQARVGKLAPLPAPRPEVASRGRQDTAGTIAAGARLPLRPEVPPAASEVPRKGVLRPQPGKAGGEIGAVASESPRRGERGDVIDAAQASNEHDPVPFELSRPSAGGQGGRGVAGPRPGPGNSAQSPRAGAAQGGSPADLATRAAGQASTRATAQDLYMRRLYDKVRKAVKYPPELAELLEQGDVVVHFTLNRDGSVARVAITRSSGFEAMDEALRLAVLHAAPFGPVPEAIHGGRASVEITAPFAFAAPLIH
jgi:protein TonB